jgi:alkanesulfonate monooxygenase SsuD/methylene tetrahydromethanopterin reductase-like flavin-dependent oxidoreductase (luciferase family)
MKIGIGLPSTVPGADGGQVREWAVRSEAAGFSTLGTIDRIVYPNHESLIALAYAAGATERIGLLTSILLAPVRLNTALLAKQAASLDVLSGGRLTLGLAPGGRADDYEVSGIDYHARGRIFDSQLEELQRLWRGDEVGPKPAPGRPEVVIGGAVEASFRRAARFGRGWMMGGGAPDQFVQRLEGVRAAWAESGRDDEPRILALGYYALGPSAREQARDYIGHYYAYLGEEAARGFADSIPATADDVKARTDAFAEAGCDEFIWFPTSADPEQVDLLSEVVPRTKD